MSTKVHVISFKVPLNIYQALAKRGAEEGHSAHIFARTLVYRQLRKQDKKSA